MIGEKEELKRALDDVCVGTCPSGCCHKRDVLAHEVVRLRREVRFLVNAVAKHVTVRGDYYARIKELEDKASAPSSRRNAKVAIKRMDALLGQVMKKIRGLESKF